MILLVVLVVKNPPANAGVVRDVGLIHGSGGFPGGGHGNPLLYSCLENLMDRGAWWATVHSMAESDMTEATQHAHMILLLLSFSYSTSFTGVWSTIFTVCLPSPMRFFFL